jgi:hypothetical protein
MKKSTLEAIRKGLLDDPTISREQWAANLKYFTEITDGIQGQNKPPAAGEDLRPAMRQALNFWTNEAGRSIDDFLEIVPRLK